MFGIASKKRQIVGMAVTPNLGIEAAVYDKKTGEITRYAKKFLEYNIASRTIQNRDAFKAAVSALFSEIDIPPERASVFLVLPNVYFGFRSIEDKNTSAENIESIVKAEATSSYIFKQEEASIAFVDVNQGTGANFKHIAFSALQESVKMDIQDDLMDCGTYIAGVESAITAIPRGLAISGLCDDLIAGNKAWDILIVNSNNYLLIQMEGKRILDCVEVPFAIMSFEGEEVYPALSSAVGQYLINYPAKKLFVISQTDNVSAKLLKSALVFDEQIIAIDSNEYGMAPAARISQDVPKGIASSMSLSLIGATVPQYNGFATLNSLKTNIYDGTASYGYLTFGNKSIELNSESILKVGVSIIALLVVALAVTVLPLYLLDSNLAREQGELQGQIDTLNSQNGELENKIKSNVGAMIKQISDNNKQSINYYDSLSTDIPSNVWLTYYINKKGKEVGIEGLSVDINSVYEYFRSLKLLAPSSDVQLNKLDVFQKDGEENQNNDINNDDIIYTESDRQQIFSFEISNTTYDKYFDEKGNKSQNQGDESQKGGTKKKVIQKSVPDVPDVDANLKEAN